MTRTTFTEPHTQTTRNSILRLVNIHRVDDSNIGDNLSSPLHYFSFNDRRIITSTTDILSNLDAIDADIIIVGGGGLLDKFFSDKITSLKITHPTTKLVAWGLGQQLDRFPWWKDYKAFPYDSYLNGFTLTGIRDYGFSYPWVPCPSCMHLAFDKHRSIKHEFVVFSHRKYPIPIKEYPTLSNNTKDFGQVLDFLSSGETILTSSYHGMYWGILLGRRVLAFPFNSKFLTLKYPVTTYPAIWRKARFPKLFPFSNTSALTRECNSVEGWRRQAGASRAYPEALEECRQQNKLFYSKVMNLLS